MSTAHSSFRLPTAPVLTAGNCGSRTAPQPGTVLVKDIRTGGDSNPMYLTVFNGTLYFQADDGSNGTEVWKSDGSEAGTVITEKY